MSEPEKRKLVGPFFCGLLVTIIVANSPAVAPALIVGTALGAYAIGYADGKIRERLR